MKSKNICEIRVCRSICNAVRYPDILSFSELPEGFLKKWYIVKMVYSNMPSGKKEFLDIAIKAAKLAGQVILNNIGKISKRDINLKRTSDFVTSVDRESERVIIDTIKEKFPESPLFSRRIP